MVVGTDGSPQADRAVVWAAAEAVRGHRPLHIVHVVEDQLLIGPDRIMPGIRQRMVDRSLQILMEAQALAVQADERLVVETRLVHDRTPRAGIGAHSSDAHEVVVGHRGIGGFAELLLGSTGLLLAGHLPLPVVIVRGEEDAPADTVVAGIDLTDPPETVLEYAFAAAAEREARLHVVHAWRPAPLAAAAGADLKAAQTMFSDHVAAALVLWRERHPQVKVTEDVVQGHPAETLVGCSAHADLVVVGYRTHAGPHLGSVSHGVIHHAHCPVAVVRPRS
ncbi:universal stress protein [Actinomadura barringtoniae]|uniref:Universal stress protein n=1 Tax=Actinomadura barringtoniae TaxID=1427535 RepID=A0A939P8Z0_9ACTN|nr:universal stress protein [Actinomadura barringtoniae]MBO2447958.1 universal stress protein [Actinomadura barringtoniae]